jgi:NADPH-dependent glutamate synthase beta subunit-like oxidoreductase/NAD(P)H-flavin reductase
MQQNLKFKNYTFTELRQPSILQKLDAEFLAELQEHQLTLHKDLIDYRAGKAYSPVQLSEFLIALSKPVENFIAELFHIEVDLEKSRQTLLAYSPIFTFKKWFVMRRAKRHLSQNQTLPDFAELDAWLETEIGSVTDKSNRELAIAQYAEKLLLSEDAYKEQIDKLTQWCIQAFKTSEGQTATAHWISFKLPKARDYQKLIPIIPETALRQRDGFNLTDPGMNLKSVLDEIHYCVYCHEHDGDLCSKGFKEKNSDPIQFKKNPLNNALTGCPLEEKISEMHLLKRDGHTISALAMVMLDNPMCPATGHRICNDCMKACIYQKQEPVNIPEIETRVLTDVLDLPYGVEIYDLLTRWNPLRQRQWVAKPYNNHRILIAGMGPAGFTLAHHLLMEGFAIVGVDGLKIEALPEKWINSPIKDFRDITAPLSERVVSGFGGVAEYGITARWDKNFLTLIYLTLLRRPHFQVFGNVRFGGTITVEKAWELGFDHLAVAVGAGLPKALPIPGSLAKGMRQANDFLMTLQLMGAAKENSLANLQLRLPALIIGGGLTGVDTATEAQAYYIKQVEKIAYRYELLKNKYSKEKILEQLDVSSQELLHEFLTHAAEIKQEREYALNHNAPPNFIKLIRKWGGVSIVYRKTMQESPAYISNHEELHKALEEGIGYIESYQPQTIILDEYQEVKALMAEHRDTHEEKVFPARSILVATGANLNIAYEFEHKGTFERHKIQYVNYELKEQTLVAAPTADHIKSPHFGGFTSYQKDNKFVTFLGDSHPVFHGNVVNAIASAMKIYPKILELFTENKKDNESYDRFADRMKELFSSSVVSVTPFTTSPLVREVTRSAGDEYTEIEIHSPLAAQQWQPGQFYRLQNFETTPDKKNIASEAVALIAFDVNPEKGTLKFMLQPKGASTRLLTYLKPGDPVALMGPTGVRSKIPHDHQTILIIGESLSLAYLRAVAPALKAAGNRVLYCGIFKIADEFYCQEEIEKITDLCIYSVEKGTAIPTHRSQDLSLQAKGLEAFIFYMQKHLLKVDRVTVIGSPTLLEEFQLTRKILSNCLEHTKVFGSAYAPMQCMLKGVCSQCLTWQIDPHTGERKKAVYACSWQDQPLELIDTHNLEERLKQNQLSEVINELWLEYNI